MLAAVAVSIVGSLAFSPTCVAVEPEPPQFQKVRISEDRRSSPEAAKNFDFVSIHVYPGTEKVDQAIAALAVYDIGKPLVVEETFPLH